jgi:hypothetical protein
MKGHPWQTKMRRALREYKRRITTTETWKTPQKTPTNGKRKNTNNY